MLQGSIHSFAMLFYQLLWRSLYDDFPLIHDGHLIAQILRLFHVVGG